MDRMSLVLVLVLLSGVPARGLAQEHGHDATSHRSFDNVEHWTSVFDDPARDAWQKPEELVAALKLAPGARVADLGAGTGYLLPYLSRAVGPEGEVIAVDTEPNLVEHMRRRAQKEGLSNVTPRLAAPDDPRLAPGNVDLVLILDTFHHIDDRLEYARALAGTLRPGGRVAIVDWQKRELPVGPKGPHKLPRAHVVSEMEEAGFTLVAEPDVLPYQYFLIFAPRSSNRKDASS